mmetsp:Transcript_133790/g.333957  ORF Transcript_133790/g.333957 Transcript_133790/m.333957 type:complete len:244 (-) Transcript_133790:349-1080(-)
MAPHFVDLRVRRLQLSLVLVCRIADRLLDEGEALRHGGVVADAAGELAHGGLHGLELFCMLVNRVTNSILEEGQALLNRSVSLLRGTMTRMVVLYVLVMSILDGLELPLVFVGRIPHQLFQVCDPLGHGRVLDTPLAVCLLQVAVASLAIRQAAVKLLELCMGLLQLALVLVGGVPQHPLDIVHPLLHGRVVRERPVVVLYTATKLLQLAVVVRVELRVLGEGVVQLLEAAFGPRHATVDARG